MANTHVHSNAFYVIMTALLMMINFVLCVFIVAFAYFMATAPATLEEALRPIAQLLDSGIVHKKEEDKKQQHPSKPKDKKKEQKKSIMSKIYGKIQALVRAVAYVVFRFPTPVLPATVMAATFYIWLANPLSLVQAVVREDKDKATVAAATGSKHKHDRKAANGTANGAPPFAVASPSEGESSFESTFPFGDDFPIEDIDGLMEEMQRFERGWASFPNPMAGTGSSFLPRNGDLGPDSGDEEFLRRFRDHMIHRQGW